METPLPHHSDWFYADHERTRQQLAAFGAMLRDATASDADRLACFQSLLNELKQHLVCEEQAFFPILGRYRPMILLAVEHEDLMAAGTDVLQALQADSTGQDQILGAMDHFQNRLAAHMDEEESGVMPFAHSAMAPEEHAWVARRVEELREQMRDPAVLERLWQRETPRSQRGSLPAFEAATRPIQYHPLFSSSQAQVQQLSLHSGQALARHWSPQHQWLLLLSGQVVFYHASGEAETLDVGDCMTLEPRYCFSLEATCDATLLLVKAWPTGSA
jgi:hemerythrin-like domain-containing protein